LSRIFIEMEARCAKINLLEVVEKAEKLDCRGKPLLGILTGINSYKGMKVHFFMGDKGYLSIIRDSLGRKSESIGYLETQLKDTIN